MDDPVATVQRSAAALYGPAATRPVHGVLHVVSAVEVDGRLHVIKIGPTAPKSEHDWFVLNYWRAHADAIVTTAAIVRAEPALSHELQGAHAAYRSQRLHKSEPLVAILTRAGDLPLEHPVWRDRARNYVLTTPERATALRASLTTRATVTGIADLDLLRAIDWLFAQGARCILIEAGPSTANQLYASGHGVDHLLLSRYLGGIDPSAIGGPLAAPARLFAGLSRVAATDITEPSGLWRFERWDRPSGAGSSPQRE